MSRRLYVGRLPPDSRAEDLQKLFDGYGRVTDCRVMTGFGFVEFEAAKDAEDALHNFNGKSFMGNNIVVEFAKDSRPRREPREDRGYPPPRSRRPPGFRVVVTGLSRDTSWQDLKDFGREAGMVTFADVDRDTPGSGVLEYPNREDFDTALKTLDGRDLRGNAVRVAEDTSRPEDRRDSYRDDRRRDRSRSPRRAWREDDRRESFRREDRSPRREFRESSPRREHREDRHERGGRYEDRRGGGDPDRRRDERPRDRDERYEERRPANGDSGWTR